MARLPVVCLLLACLALAHAQRCSEKLDLVLVIDASGSIRDNNPADGSFDNWGLMKDFLRSLLETFTVGPVSD